jgi:tetratricopeptide (TPR) repeat protein
MATIQTGMNQGLEQKNLTVDDLLKIAREDIARNSLTSAERALEQAILINNQVAEAFHLLGMVYSKRGKFKKAILSFEKALSLDAFHTDAAIALSSLYNDVGKYKEGAGVFFKTKKRLERMAPGFDPRINQGLAEKHFELGTLYMRYERFSEAYHEFSKAYGLQPEKTLNCVQMAKCLGKAGDKDGAISLLQKALEKDPKNSEAKIQLGILFHSKQKVRDAYKQWQEVLTIEPDNKSAQMYLSMYEYEPDPSPVPGRART